MCDVGHDSTATTTKPMDCTSKELDWKSLQEEMSNVSHLAMYNCRPGLGIPQKRGIEGDRGVSQIQSNKDVPVDITSYQEKQDRERDIGR